MQTTQTKTDLEKFEEFDRMMSENSPVDKKQYLEKNITYEEKPMWRTAAVPRKGWKCVEVEDLEERSHLCVMCREQIVRYVHYMYHPEYTEILRVGCVCAGHMEQDLKAARDRDRAVKNTSRRRKNWLTRKWKTSKNGNDYLIDRRQEIQVTIFLDQYNWQYRYIANSKFSEASYTSQDEAKMAAFEFLNNTKLRSKK